MKSFRTGLFALSLCAIIATGCSHVQQEKQLDKKIANQPAPRNTTGLINEADRLIQNTPGLSEDQRLKLYDLRDSTRVQIQDCNAQSLKLRSILLQDLLSSKKNAKEIDLLKKKIQSVEKEKVDALLSAVDRAKGILGYKFATHKHVVNDLLEDRATLAIQ
jgi:hypothetical protein